MDATGFSDGARLDAGADGAPRLLELERRHSLARSDPESLADLRRTGACSFDLPELAFDLDHAGDWMRRIHDVGLVLPCAADAPPFDVELTLIRASVRVEPPDGGPYVRADGVSDPRFADWDFGDTIALPARGADGGLFEADRGSDRFAFAGAGAISEWRVVVRGRGGTFAPDAISDLVMTMRYTARPCPSPALPGVRDQVRALASRDPRFGV